MIVWTAAAGPAWAARCTQESQGGESGLTGPGVGWERGRWCVFYSFCEKASELTMSTQSLSPTCRPFRIRRLPLDSLQTFRSASSNTLSNPPLDDSLNDYSLNAPNKCLRTDRSPLSIQLQQRRSRSADAADKPAEPQRGSSFDVRNFFPGRFRHFLCFYFAFDDLCGPSSFRRLGPLSVFLLCFVFFILVSFIVNPRLTFRTLALFRFGLAFVTFDSRVWFWLSVVSLHWSAMLQVAFAFHDELSFTFVLSIELLGAFLHGCFKALTRAYVHVDVFPTHIYICIGVG